ncbi:hypothetical protein PM082_018193 [Marasmius tenuissimus]|nr:hypothetical protein PM082_018193 [Marasmius tenuissimus]
MCLPIQSCVALPSISISKSPPTPSPIAHRMKPSSWTTVSFLHPSLGCGESQDLRTAPLSPHSGHFHRGAPLEGHYDSPLCLSVKIGCPLTLPLIINLFF